jgi:hypothetical protein
VSNKDTIIEALTIQLKIEREGNFALVNRIAELEKQEPLVWMNKYGHVASFKNDEYTAPLYTRPVVHEVRCTYPQCQATNGCVGVCSKGQPDLARVGEVGVWGEKREWIGLTDEERAECWNSSAVQSAINIEAKLKEKNT